VVLTFAPIIALRKQFDRIDILCQDQIGKLAVKLGLVENAYPLETAYFATLFSDQADAKIKDFIRRYEKIVAFSFSAELEKAINEITTSPCVRIPPRPPARDSIHVAEYLLQNLIYSGLIKTADADEALSFRQRKQTVGADQSIEISKIIIHPGSGSIRKRWPLDRFLELAEVLERRGLRPQFVCGPAETDLVDKIRRHHRQVQRFIELTELADCMKTAGGYIGNDSGISHLTAFMGIPCVVIFGPADPKRWTPPGPRVQIVRPAVDCDPCFEIESHNCDRPACLTDATLESVLQAFDGIYMTKF
jgi:ADP-heptose:LPS heptosyltransferase